MSFFEGILNQEDVIVVNKQFCDQLNEPYGLDHPDILQKIIDEFNGYDSISDDKEKAIQKVCCLLVGLVFEQPFKNGNKRTSVSISLLIMRIHHHDIRGYKNEITQEEFYQLLYNTMMKMEGDQTIKSELEEYLRENLTKI